MRWWGTRINPEVPEKGIWGAIFSDREQLPPAVS
jgi:hypothetical protein